MARAGSYKLSEPAQIRNCAMHIYTRLYQSELADIDTVASAFFNSLPKVVKDSHSEVDKTYTLQELDQESPRIDELLVELDKVFWSAIGEDLLAMLSKSLRKGLLPLHHTVTQEG